MKYKFKTRPYKHQREALSKLISNGYGGALLMAPRTGKSKTLIDWCSVLHQAGKADKVVVVAPLSVLRVWRDEIALHCPVDDAMVVLWDRQGRKEIRLPSPVRRLTFVLINYDAFASPGRKARPGAHKKNAKRRGGVSGRTQVKDALLDWSPDVMILDESHKIKTPSAKKTASIKRVAWIEHRKPNANGDMRTELVPYRAIATGTAITKKKRVYDIYSQWKFLNPDRLDEYDVGDFKSFKDEFVREKDMDGYRMWMRNKNEARLRQLIHSDAYAITREECFDLPKRSDQIVPVVLEPEAIRVYDELAEHMIADIMTEKERARQAREEGRPAKEWKVTASIPLVAILRLSQLTSGIASVENAHDDEKRVVRVSKAKLDACKGLLEDEWESDQKVVVAARFKPDLAAVYNLGVRARGVRAWLIAGGVSAEDRHIAIEQFKRWEGPGLMVVQPQAASLGIDLRSASTMIWYSLTPSYVDFSQTCDRIALSDKSTTFKYLLAEGTYDEQLYATLQEDESVVKAVTASPDTLRRRELR